MEVSIVPEEAEHSCFSWVKIFEMVGLGPCIRSWAVALCPWPAVGSSTKPSVPRVYISSNEIKVLKFLTALIAYDFSLNGSVQFKVGLWHLGK
jgi:hypothetical protein